MSFPTTIIVGPYEYTVRLDKDRIEELEKESGDELYGMTTHNLLEIAVHPHMHNTLIKETLLHEVLHAVLYVTGISHGMSDDDEEQLIRSLSPCLFMLLRDNPGLVDCLVGCDG